MGNKYPNFRFISPIRTNGDNDRGKIFIFSFQVGILNFKSVINGGMFDESKCSFKKN